MFMVLGRNGVLDTPLFAVVITLPDCVEPPAHHTWQQARNQGVQEGRSLP